MKKIAYLGFFLSLVTSLSAIVLATVNEITTPIILEAQASSFAAALESAFPTATGSRVIGYADDIYELYILEILEVVEDDEVLGYIYTKSVPGLGGPIMFLLGIGVDGHFTTFEVVSHSETPGIGDVIERPDWIDSIVHAPGSEPIDVVTGATGTTEAVSRAIGVAYENFRLRRPH